MGWIDSINRDGKKALDSVGQKLYEALRYDIPQSVSAIFTSLTLDAGIGTGLYINGNLGPFELTSGSYQEFLAIHYSWDDGFNIGQNWEESGGVGIY